MLELFLAHLVYFAAVIDPIGSVPVLIAVTRGYDAQLKRTIAIKSVGVATLVLILFVLVGEFVFTAMNVPLPAFRIAGGIVLFLFALSMVFGESKPEEEVRLAEKAAETAIYPMAIPSIAGPGAMLAAVLLTDNATYSLAEQAITVLSMICVLIVTLILLLAAGPIHKVIGKSGASIVSRVMGIILASVAMANILEGVRTYFSL